MLTYQEALKVVLGHAKPLALRREPLSAVLGRVLAEAVRASEPYPLFRNAAMDGYAVRAEDCAGATESKPVRLDVLGDVAAGRVATCVVTPGTAIRIMTGAPVPDGADSVVPVERTVVLDSQVELCKPVKLGAHVRSVGEDVPLGACVLEAGTVLGAAEIGLLATLGIMEVPVIPVAALAVVTTGDELVDAGTLPGPGKIRDSNSHALCAQAASFGVTALSVPRVPDRKEAVEAALRHALETADVLVTTGGISVGDYDFVKDVLEGLGAQRIFWRVAQKPGGPLGFWMLGGKPVFGIPGSPHAAMVAMEEYVRPMLRKMMGFARLHRPVHRGVLDEVWRKKREDGCVHFLRVAVESRGQELLVHRAGLRGGGVPSSPRWDSALALFPPEVLSVPAGGDVLLHLTEEREDH